MASSSGWDSPPPSPSAPTTAAPSPRWRPAWTLGSRLMADSMLSTEEQISSIWSLGGLTWRELVRRVWGGINRNDLINRAYELAYNFLLAVFPMMLFLLGLLGLFEGEGSKLR